MKFEVHWVWCLGIFLGIPIGIGIGGCRTNKSKQPATQEPKPIQWIGKLTAGDGQANGAVFMCREIEIGLGEKGELVWRRVNAPPMPLKSTATNAEAK